ncbi:DUF6702 family protein [uncultured Winogradskyella sp.]|uniref:DUF6702 family protein n=1 Tax=uncultured Winogradskyella sp. TaxID=395353 RepID=UPI003514C236
MKYYLLILFFPILLGLQAAHEYYVSVTTVTYVEEQEAVQIISQIFIDDFEKALRERYNSEITLAVKNESESVDSLMDRYLKAKLRLWINGKEVEFKFLGKEYKDDIAYCYLEILGVSDIKSISMKNEILLDVFETQQNIARFKVLDKNKSFLLVRDSAECMLNFD